MLKNELFPEFPPITKNDWLKQVNKDLKDRPLDDFDWIIGQDLHISPFVHAEDFGALPMPLQTNKINWEISEEILVEDAVTANGQAMEALNGGVEALQFVFNTAPDWAVFEQTLANIHLDFIGLHFSGPGTSQNPAAIFGHLLRLAKVQGLNTALLRGSVAYDPVRTGGIIDWRYLVDLMVFAQDQFPSFKIISVALSANENPVIALSETLKVVQQYFHKLDERGVAPEITARFLQFSVPVGKSYFLEIAKIRALQLLWFNLLKGWNVPVIHPHIAAHLHSEAYNTDLYTNMIRATTMAMSAVLGGADQISVLPYDAGREDMARYPALFGRRIARNVQHLMKMESHLEDIADPAAGSYYLEKLTAALAEKGWEAFAHSE